MSKWSSDERYAINTISEWLNQGFQTTSRYRRYFIKFDDNNHLNHSNYYYHPHHLLFLRRASLRNPETNK